MIYRGIITALVTPTDSNGNLDEKQLKHLINFQLQNKVNGIALLGGTGEYNAISFKDKKKAIEITVDTVAQEIPVIIGIVEPGLPNAIEIGKYSRSVGADAVMIITPYYVHPTQKGIIDYYQKFDVAVNLPILLYNIPHRTGVNIEPQTVVSLIETNPNVVGIKECTTNMAQFVELLQLVGDQISVLSGEEFYAIPELIFGAHGAVMATANVIPEVWVKIWNSIERKSFDKAVEIYLKHFPLFKAIFKEGNPGPLKKAMNFMNMEVGSVSSPLIAPKKDTIDELEKALKIVKNQGS